MPAMMGFARNDELGIMEDHRAWGKLLRERIVCTGSSMVFKLIELHARASH
jgi:hypothetical protein